MMEALCMILAMISNKFLIWTLGLTALSTTTLPALSQTPMTTTSEESKFVQLNPPPPYSYKDGSMKRYTENGRRYIIFEGTTLIPPYFRKDTEYVFKPIWSPDPRLSIGRWVWTYKIDCEELSFDREYDQVGWRSVRWDPTAMAASDLFCPKNSWELLPQK
jgi:hypothetical protein